MVIRGRVQGVGFRYFAVREASSLGVRGYVRNMEDGDAVEIVACGDAQSVDDLVARLSAGPAGADVTGVTTQRINPVTAYSDFTIHH